MEYTLLERTVEHLENNLTSLQVELPTDDSTALDKLTKRRPKYPIKVLPAGRLTGYGSLTINGESFPESP